ncbi:MAG: tetratricopeptide repeat protein, partial [Planctomycetota bacterium]
QDERIEEAEQYARRALALDPDSAEAHLTLGFSSVTFRGDPAAACRHLKRALAISSDDPHALMWLCVTYTGVGKADAAMSLAERLALVDPLTPMSGGVRGLVEFNEGRFAEAVRWSSLWFGDEPENPAALFFHVLFLAHAGRVEEACALVDEQATSEVTDQFTALSVALRHAAEGRVEEMIRSTSGELGRTIRRDPQSASYAASIFALGGETNGAIDWLETAIGRGFFNYPFLAEHDRLLDPVRQEPRFKELLHKTEEHWRAFEG